MFLQWTLGFPWTFVAQKIDQFYFGVIKYWPAKTFDATRILNHTVFFGWLGEAFLPLLASNKDAIVPCLVDTASCYPIEVQAQTCAWHNLVILTRSWRFPLNPSFQVDCDVAIAFPQHFSPYCLLARTEKPNNSADLHVSLPRGAFNCLCEGPESSTTANMFSLSFGFVYRDAIMTKDLYQSCDR